MFYTSSTDVVGYTYEADTWCSDCLPVDESSGDVSPIFEGDTWDYDVHCSACHELLLFKFRECSLCHQPIWEYQEYEEGDVTGHGNVSAHTSCIDDFINGIE